MTKRIPRLRLTNINCAVNFGTVWNDKYFLNEAKSRYYIRLGHKARTRISEGSRRGRAEALGESIPLLERQRLV